MSNFSTQPFFPAGSVRVAIRKGDSVVFYLEKRPDGGRPRRSITVLVGDSYVTVLGSERSRWDDSEVMLTRPNGSLLRGWLTNVTLLQQFDKLT